MDQRNQRTSQSVGNILQVTKNIIQENENFYDYYINKDNSLYYKQLPLLIRKAKLQAIAIYKKENKKQQENYPLTTGDSPNLLDNIRNAQIRSKKLPPLCPFYNDKGELVPSVVKTSRVYNRYDFDNNETPTNIMTLSGKRHKKLLDKILRKNEVSDNGNVNDFEKNEKCRYDKKEYDRKFRETSFSAVRFYCHGKHPCIIIYGSAENVKRKEF